MCSKMAFSRGRVSLIWLRQRNEKSSKEGLDEEMGQMETKYRDEWAKGSAAPFPVTRYLLLREKIAQ